MAEKNKGGRPLKFKDAEALQKAVDSYFSSLNGTDSDGNPVAKRPTVSGLALHLDIDTETLRNYSKRGEFFGIIKRAKQRVEQALEERLYENSPTGVIFNLKCNFGYREQEHVEKEPASIKINFNVSEKVEHDNS